MPELTMRELRELIGGGVPPTPTACSERREIVIADRGWVFVGYVTMQHDGAAEIRDASTVRVWGTVRGLGQLALEGPQVGTKLDPCGSVTVPSSAIVARMVCAIDKWR
ncbi:MAG: hypothetical protein EKK62_17090 [Acidimicrobiia bacterium]|nr:MAG: hypothetical protein EKK62_17090 [Acidimicrobiia bacterium]